VAVEEDQLAGIPLAEVAGELELQLLAATWVTLAC
jgi:hypothetical protein